MSPQEIPTVGIVVFDGDQVLLVRHGEAAGHLTDTYGLPAGRIELNETAKGAAKRELLEETGLTAEDFTELPERYRAEIERKDGSTALFVWTVFWAQRYSGELRESAETRPEWVGVSDLAQYNLLPNVANAIKQTTDFKNEKEK